MVDFINEVEEELRKDDYNRLLKKFGPTIAVILVAIVAGAGYMEYRDYAKARVAKTMSADYVAADKLVEAGEPEAAIKTFTSLSEVAPAGYAGLSLMRAGALYLEAGQVQDAVIAFDKAATHFEAPRHKELAQLKAAYALVGQGSYDGALTRLEPLMAQGAPYEYLARELSGFAAQQSGKIKLARQEFSYLSSIPGVPATIQQRAEQALALMQEDDDDDPSPETVAPADTDPVTDEQNTDKQNTDKEDRDVQNEE